MPGSPRPPVVLPFAWLKDSPLFIDEQYIRSFYDAILRPDTETQSITITQENIRETDRKITGGLGAEASLPLLFNVFKTKIQGNLQIDWDKHTTDSNKKAVTLTPINNPYRQLIQLAYHYAELHGDRIALITREVESLPNWHKDSVILGSPRPFTFLDLPKHTAVIPVAAEVSDGEILLLFKPLASELQKESKASPPPYEDVGPSKSDDDVRKAQRRYWTWFRDSFDAVTAMELLEKLVMRRNRIRWIAYRVVLGAANIPLHLSVSAHEQYDAGVFAYDIIKRGWKHGLRMIGTLRTEPGMHVLAIFEK